MFEKIPVPVKGQPARASWGAGLTNRVNELCAMAPARGLARDGLTGTGFAALPENRRDRCKSQKIPGRFEIVSITKEEPEEDDEQQGGEQQNGESQDGEQNTTYCASFTNLFYDVAGKTYELEIGDDEDASAAVEGIPDGGIVALKIKANSDGEAELAAVAGIRELKTRQEDVSYYTVPLYMISGGAVSCDFRTGPTAVMGEVL